MRDERESREGRDVEEFGVRSSENLQPRTSNIRLSRLSRQPRKFRAMNEIRFMRNAFCAISWRTLMNNVGWAS